MKMLARFLILLIAVEHIGILVLEMFFWNHPLGQRIFGMSAEVAAASEVLARNQGLYNGFLAAGLFWGLVSDRRNVQLFFLGSVIAAGLFGGLTAKTSILFTQGLPALATFVVVYLSQNTEK